MSKKQEQEWQPGKIQITTRNPDGTTGIVYVRYYREVLDFLRTAPHDGPLFIQIESKGEK